MWILGRSIDFHERNPWAVVWVGLSPTNEAFIYREFDPSPVGGKWTNESIAREIARLSGKERFVLNLIDPLANKTQTNTGITIVADLNEHFWKAKKEGIGQGGYWEPFDTKGTKGREEIRKRLHNAEKCKRPYNNEVELDGRLVFLPTLWILRSCPITAKSMKQWRYDEWAARELVVKDRKEQTSQKFSHFCTAVEGLFKDNRFVYRPQDSAKPRAKRPDYFKTRKSSGRHRRRQRYTGERH